MTLSTKVDRDSLVASYWLITDRGTKEKERRLVAKLNLAPSLNVHKCGGRLMNPVDLERSGISICEKCAVEVKVTERIRREPERQYKRPSNG